MADAWNGSNYDDGCQSPPDLLWQHHITQSDYWIMRLIDSVASVCEYATGRFMSPSDIVGYGSTLSAGILRSVDVVGMLTNLPVVIYMTDRHRSPGDGLLHPDRGAGRVDARAILHPPLRGRVLSGLQAFRATASLAETYLLGCVHVGIKLMMLYFVCADLANNPGEILAQVSRDIYDSQQRHLLIPRGTKVIGRYDNQVALGQSRVLIAWTRLVFPDGRSLSLPGLPTKDLRGASGVPTHVSNHYGRLYGQAALLSVIGAGAQLSQPQQSNILAAASAGQVAAGALGQELSQVSMEAIRRNMDVRPTLEVKAGTPFYIFLERDLVLDEPYVERWAAEDRPISSHGQERSNRMRRSLLRSTLMTDVVHYPACAGYNRAGAPCCATAPVHPSPSNASASKPAPVLAGRGTVVVVRFAG